MPKGRGFPVRLGGVFSIRSPKSPPEPVGLSLGRAGKIVLCRVSVSVLHVSAMQAVRRPVLELLMHQCMALRTLLRGVLRIGWDHTPLSAWFAVNRTSMFQPASATLLTEC